MARAGRPSANAIAIKPLNNVTKTERVRPPATLTDLERDTFMMVVNDQPAQAFTQVHIPSLIAYCRHKIQSDILADAVLNFDRAWLDSDEGLKRYDLLLKMQSREIKGMQDVARSLRITRQSVDQQTVARMNETHKQTPEKKPWEA